MTKIYSKLLLIIFFVLMSVILSSCATLGTTYQKVRTIPDNVALVYIYRPSNVAGFAVSYDVKVGETPIVTLHNGGYYPYFSEPGKVGLWAQTESTSLVSLDVKAGQTYYIKGTVGPGILVGRPYLWVMSQEEAEKEIEACKLIHVEEKK